MFENDVEMYGAQAKQYVYCAVSQFENDVEMYGAQASEIPDCCWHLFENDVEMYGAQADKWRYSGVNGLRMM